MAPKRAMFLCYGDDEVCRDTQKFIEDSGVIVDSRDIEKNPLSEAELDRLVGTLSIGHFINTMAPAYTKNGWDKSLPTREEAIEAMVQDHTLIRRPIIKASRLITIGSDKKRITEMLQVGQCAIENVPQPRQAHRSSNNNSNKKGHRAPSRSPR